MKILRKLFARKNKPASLATYGSPNAPTRILVFTDALGATFQIYLGSLLQTWQNEKRPFVARVYSHALLNENSQINPSLTNEFETFNPTHVVFCRFAHSSSEFIFSLCQKQGCKTLYHLDDNLFKMPEENLAIYKTRHLAPEIVAARQFLITHCDQASFSTQILQHQIQNYFPAMKQTSILPCWYSPTSAAKKSTSRTIGYMGTKSHLKDLDLIKGLVVDFLTDNPQWKFELFGDLGDIQFPESIRSQVQFKTPVKDYISFKKALVSTHWALAFAPLQPHFFNEAKSPIKLIEYTEAGIVSLLSDWGPYQAAVRSGAALKIDGINAKQLSALANNALLLEEKLKLAQQFCAQSYSYEDSQKSLQDALSIKF